MNITLEQASTLIAVIENGSLLMAAESLNKSHSALIYLIKNLETECGFALFDRDKYRNKPSDKGLKIYLACKELVHKKNELHNLCENLKNNWEPSFKLVYDAVFDFDIFLQLYKNIKSKKIPTTIQMHSSFLNEVESDFKKLQADLMISILKPTSDNYKSFQLKPIKMKLVAHHLHPLCLDSKSKSLDELKNYHFITVRQTQAHLNLETSELENQASFYFSDFNMKKEAICHQMGFGWLPQHLIERELSKKTLRPIKWTGHSEVYVYPHIYVKKDKLMGKAGQFVLDHLLTAR